MQLGYAILLPDEIHNVLRRLQLTVARQCGGPHAALQQIPHLTLKHPFDAKELGPLEAYFDQLVATVQPFEIRYCGINTFEEDGVIFLDVEPNAELEELRRRVLAELHEQFRIKPRDIEDDRYHHHSSIAFGLSPEQLATAVAALRPIAVNLRFTFDTLGLFYNTGDMWIVAKRARLLRGPRRDRRAPASYLLSDADPELSC